MASERVPSAHFCLSSLYPPLLIDRLRLYNCPLRACPCKSSIHLYVPYLGSTRSPAYCGYLGKSSSPLLLSSSYPFPDSDPHMIVKFGPLTISLLVCVDYH